MSNLLDLPEGDDDIFFVGEDDERESMPTAHWCALIVDDDDEVHNVTRLALEDFVFDGRRLAFISAHSAKEAREKIAAHPETAVILLDVVMEDDEAGLRFVHELRGPMNNKLVRVILRTGQPGQAPERRVIVDYDINDYKTKPELTSQRLFTTMVTALRSFRDLTAVEQAKEELAELNDSLERRVEERTTELRATQAQLVQASKMASLGSLVAGVAHEINTPIASVAGSEATLRRAVDRMRHRLQQADQADPKVLAYMKVVTDSSEVIKLGASRVADIVNRLRRFARLDEASRQRVSVNDCVRDARELLPSGDIAVETTLGDIPELECFPDRLNHVLLNVLTNAMEAMEGNGTLTVDTRFDGTHVAIRVVDTGAGMDADTLARMFDPGFTTKMGGVGTGLGLAIAYQVVGDHGGTIEATSELGRGTTVTIRLPV